MHTMTPEYTYSDWSYDIRPCSACDYVGPLHRKPYENPFIPCPVCGAQRYGRVGAGRFAYRLEPVKWFPLIKRKVFDHVEWEQVL